MYHVYVSDETEICEDHATLDLATAAFLQYASWNVRYVAITHKGQTLRSAERIGV